MSRPIGMKHSPETIARMRAAALANRENRARAGRASGGVNRWVKRGEEGRQPPKYSHGMKGTPTHNSWRAMLERCNNPNNIGYANYGGRGIKVCAEWVFFENFLADMGIRPEGMFIDRVNNEGNYEPGNCRWATRLEQNNNRRPRRPYQSSDRRIEGQD